MDAVEPARRGHRLWIKICIAILAPAAIVAIGTAALARSTDIQRSKIESMIAVEHGLVAAGSDMETSATDFARAVIDYVETSGPANLRRMNTERNDFARFQASYYELTTADSAREFSIRAAESFDALNSLGQRVVTASNARDSASHALAEGAQALRGSLHATTTLESEIRLAIALVDRLVSGGDVAALQLIAELQAQVEQPDISPEAIAAVEIVLGDARALVDAQVELASNLDRFDVVRQDLDDLLDVETKMIVEARLESLVNGASTVSDLVRTSLIATSIISSLAAVIGGIAVTRMVRRPIDSILAALSKVNAGRLDHRIASTRRDDLGALSRAIDSTVEQLQRTTVSVDELRRSQTDLSDAHESLHDAHALLAQRAMFDSLTGLPNRASLLQRLNRALGPSGTRQSVAALFIDLDRFKMVNDTLGHAAGDEVLVEAARRLKSCVRSDDTVARLGGDEFVIVCDGVGPGEIDHVVLRILTAFERDFFLTSGEAFVSASIGTAFATDDDDADSLLSAADVALYRSKQAGRGVANRFDESMRTEMNERLLIESNLRSAIDDGELRVHYQPIVALGDGSLAGFEALVRWQHPQRGLMAPDRFLPLAERSPLIGRIDEWMLASVCDQLVEWNHTLALPALPISVNVSGSDLVRPGYVARVFGCIDAAGLDRSLITLEVTETSLLRDLDVASDIIESLRAGGLRISIDDFGTGYSSFSYLQRFAVDVLKIDRSFTSAVLTSHRSAAIVEASITLARSLQYQVVAEGVESDAQRQTLIDLGCGFAQGYYFSPPVTVEIATDMLRGGLPWAVDVVASAHEPAQAEA